MDINKQKNAPNTIWVFRYSSSKVTEELGQFGILGSNTPNYIQEYT